MNDPNYRPQRSITASERAMTVWAVIALAIVLFTLTIGGCA